MSCHTPYYLYMDSETQTRSEIVYVVKTTMNKKLSSKRVMVVSPSGCVVSSKMCVADSSYKSELEAAKVLADRYNK